MNDKSENISIIDKGVTVDGIISAKGKLIVKGTVKGSLAGTTIIIADEGAVYAETKVGNITVGGVFEGELNALEGLKILPGGKCSGKIICEDLVVEAGGKLNGEVTYKTGKNMQTGKNFSGQLKT